MYKYCHRVFRQFVNYVANKRHYKLLISFCVDKKKHEFRRIAETFFEQFSKKSNEKFQSIALTTSAIFDAIYMKIDRKSNLLLQISLALARFVAKISSINALEYKEIHVTHISLGQ